MKRYTLKIPVLLAGLLALSTFNTMADPYYDGVRNLVMQAAKESDKGVIMVVSERGPEAADAAYLLSEQLENNPGYKPLLMVPMDSQLKASLVELSLHKDALPAVIFYDKKGKEVGRVVGAIPSAEKTGMKVISAQRSTVINSVRS